MGDDSDEFCTRADKRGRKRADIAFAMVNRNSQQAVEKCLGARQIAGARRWEIGGSVFVREESVCAVDRKACRPVRESKRVGVAGVETGGGTSTPADYADKYVASRISGSSGEATARKKTPPEKTVRTRQRVANGSIVNNLAA